MIETLEIPFVSNGYLDENDNEILRTLESKGFCDTSIVCCSFKDGPNFNGFVLLPLDHCVQDYQDEGFSPLASSVMGQLTAKGYGYVRFSPDALELDDFPLETAKVVNP
jgi:hypothetical protein